MTSTEIWSLQMLNLLAVLVMLIWQLRREKR